MEKFNLCNYLDEIREIAKRNDCTVTAAVDRMIVNLNTFNEYHKGTGTLNYHVLSNLWGDLTSAEKIAQKREAKSRLVENSARRRTSRRV